MCNCGTLFIQVIFPIQKVKEFHVVQQFEYLVLTVIFYVLQHYEHLVLTVTFYVLQHYEHLVLPVWMMNSKDNPDQYGVAQYCVPALTYIAQDKWITKGKIF